MEREFDDDLHRLFKDAAAREFPPDPFLHETRQRVSAMRRQRRVAGAFARVLVVAVIALASPWLTQGAALLSRGLEIVFGRCADFLGTPVGIVLAGLCVAAAYVFRKRRYPGT
jgi:hypothetical protein